MNSMDFSSRHIKPYAQMFASIHRQREKYSVLKNDTYWRIIWLIYLSHCNGKSIDISGVYNSTDLSRNTVDKRIQNLVEQSMITVTTDPKDLRRKTLHPTKTLLREVENFCANIAPAIMKTSFEIQQNH